MLNKLDKPDKLGKERNISGHLSNPWHIVVMITYILGPSRNRCRYIEINVLPMLGLKIEIYILQSLTIWNFTKIV